MKNKYNPAHCLIVHSRSWIPLGFVVSLSMASSLVAQTWDNGAATGAWNLSDLNWSGTTWINNGDAVFGAAGAVSPVSAAGVIFNDLTFNSAGYGSVANVQAATDGITGSLVLGNDQASKATVATGVTATISGILANSTNGASSLAKEGSGTLILKGANSFSGGTTINGGTLQVGNTTNNTASGSVNSLGASGSTVTVNGSGTLRFQMGGNSNNAFAQNFVFAAGSTLSHNDGRITLGSTTANAASNAYTVTINGATEWKPLWNSKQFVVGGILQGAGAINVIRPANNGASEAGYVVFLNDTNTYTGTITTSGTYSTTNTINSMTGVVVGSASALQYASIVNNSAANTNVGSGPTEVNQRSGLIFNTTTTTLGSLAGSGNFILSQNTAAITAAPNPTLAGTGVALTVGGNNTSTIYSGQISGNNGSLTKTGGGTMTLSGVNTYGGTTTITGGTLALGVTGAIDSSSGVSLGTVGTFDITAKSGGYSVKTLSGSGDVLGALTVSTTLSIGSSAGVVDFSDDLNLGGSATYLYDLNGGTAGPGSADVGNVAGDLTISAGAILDLVQLGTYTLGDKFTLFAYSGTLAGGFSGITSSGDVFTDAGGLWKINYADPSAGGNGGSGTNFVTITAIPEPGVSLLGALGLFALIRRRRS